MVKRELRDAERVYVNCILQNGIESGNNNPFGKYVKSPKQETFDISAFKSNGNVITDSLSKAEILNSKFNLFSLPNLEIHFPSCRVLNSTKLNLYIFLRMVVSCNYTGLMYQSHLDQTCFLEAYCRV